jgi:hypothetical protein
MRYLVEFLAERLHEDEAVVEAVRTEQRLGGSRWEFDDYWDPQNAAFGLRWNPDRVHSEIEAKWKIISYWEGMTSLINTPLGASNDATVLAIEYTLRALAAP